MFKVNPDANICGTYLQEREAIEASPNKLRQLFGPPATLMGDKTTHEWSFEDDEGNVFTLYDWKFYTPSGHISRGWNVGGRSYAGEFIEWLRK
jgi:hypothetical protein